MPSWEVKPIFSSLDDNHLLEYKSDSLKINGVSFTFLSKVGLVAYVYDKADSIELLDVSDDFKVKAYDWGIKSNKFW